MGFNSFKKEFEARKEQAQTLNELNKSLNIWVKKKSEYFELSKNALANKDNVQYETYLGLLKNSIFNISQIESMIANFKTASDLLLMQKLNKKFVSSFDKVMKKVNQTCKQINVSSSQKLFSKSLINVGSVSQELKTMLEDNGIDFHNVANSLSDISDSEIKDILESKIESDKTEIENSVDELESIILNSVKENSNNKTINLETNNNPNNNHSESTAFNDKSPNFDDKKLSPEDAVFEQNVDEEIIKYEFEWNDIPSTTFDDIAGLDSAKKMIINNVVLPIKYPDVNKGYLTDNGIGVCLFGPGGTGKTMFASALAHEIGAKFCSIVVGDLNRSGLGEAEKAIRQLFKEARSFPCSVVYIDEFDSLVMKQTQSTQAKRIRSEMLSQIEGIDKYRKKNSDNILVLVGATNKPWNIEDEFLRTGRFGIKVYVGPPDEKARDYLIRKLVKDSFGSEIEVRDLDYDLLVFRTNGYSCADIAGVVKFVASKSRARAFDLGQKYVDMADFDDALNSIKTSIQKERLEKILEWAKINETKI